MNRRSSTSSALSASSLAKRPASAAENPAKVPAAAVEQAKKRVALDNITNQSSGGRNVGRIGVKGTNKAKSANSTLVVKKQSLPIVSSKRTRKTTAGSSAAVITNTPIPGKDSLLSVQNPPAPKGIASLVPCSTIKSPGHFRDSVSLDETMSTCDSIKSPEFEYIDNRTTSVLASLEKRASDNLWISEHADASGSKWKRDLQTPMDLDEIIDVDTNVENPQFCATLACDIYRHLRIAEAKKRPSIDFIETVQKDINTSMRAILVDWLVEVAEEYRLVPDTLYLTVNYIDRYLSGNQINRQQLQLLGVSCMLIAAKYEEISAPQVEEFCYVTDNTYFRDEVIQMETDVLKYLKFEVTAPTVKCFLRRFIRIAQACDKDSLLQLEFLASYIAELSLLEYDMLCYAPSLVAASSVFLANYILQPAKIPWNATLIHYTLYKPSNLSECVRALHRIFCSPQPNLPAIREKYSQHKYKFVAKKYCPSSIPEELFQDAEN